MTNEEIKTLADGYYAGNADWLNKEQERDTKVGWRQGFTYALRQPPVISCVCPNEIKTGTVAIHCCNLCGKPDEDWWGKH